MDTDLNLNPHLDIQHAWFHRKFSSGTGVQGHPTLALHRSILWIQHSKGVYYG